MTCSHPSDLTVQPIKFSTNMSMYGEEGQQDRPGHLTVPCQFGDNSAELSCGGAGEDQATFFQLAKAATRLDRALSNHGSRSARDFLRIMAWKAVTTSRSESGAKLSI